MARSASCAYFIFVCIGAAIVLVADVVAVVASVVSLLVVVIVGGSGSHNSWHLPSLLAHGASVGCSQAVGRVGF